MRQRQPNLLCIDDDVQSLEIRKIVFEASGYRVLTASSGADGLRLFRSYPVDAVVLDYHMPEMDGGEVATRMKDQRPRVPILILSALPELPEGAPQCIDGFICKGGPTARLLKTVEELVTRHDELGPSPPPRFARLGIMTGLLMGKLSSLIARSHKPAQPGKPTKAPVHFRAKLSL